MLKVNNRLDTVLAAHLPASFFFQQFR